MRSPARPPDRKNKFPAVGRLGRHTSAIEAHPAVRPTMSALSSTSIRPAAFTVVARTAAQARGSKLSTPANQASSTINRGGRAGSPASPQPTHYKVQAPIYLSGRAQQIRATIQGTPQVAGSVEISRGGGGKIYISNLNVDQQHRRRGVAAKLIDAAITTARRQGFKAASLEARPSDNGISPQQLVAMYRRQGFKSVGKSGRGNPLMERKL
jgi:ribosomal protein S18 acetylase RimI-like enzyme